jgi:hypothetical protein
MSRSSARDPHCFSALFMTPTAFSDSPGLFRISFCPNSATPRPLSLVISLPLACVLLRWQLSRFCVGAIALICCNVHDPLAQPTHLRN